MDLSRVFLAYKPPIFPLDIRKGLHSYNIKKIRQSSYAKARACSNQVFLQGEPEMSVTALFGSAYHLAALDVMKGVSADQNYWFDILLKIHSQGTKYKFKGNLVQEYHLADFAKFFATGEPWNMPLMAIIMTVEAHKRNMGLVVKEREKNVNFSDPGPYPIEFDGTIDELSSYKGKLALGDGKSWGLWGPLLGSSVKAQSTTPEQMVWDTQLTHYDWMLQRKTNGALYPAYYYHYYPANVVPYVQKNKQGDMRGPVVVMCNANTRDFVSAYEYDVQQFYRSIAICGPQRGRPTNYGVMECPSCNVRDLCLGSKNRKIDDEFRTNPIFAYMREE